MWAEHDDLVSESNNEKLLLAKMRVQILVCERQQ